MNTFPTSTDLTGLTKTHPHPPMVPSFFRFFLGFFPGGAERPTEAKAGNGSGLGFGDRMALLGALEMLSAKLDRNGLPLTPDENEIYEKALRVIGPIDL